MHFEPRGPQQHEVMSSQEQATKMAELLQNTHGNIRLGVLKGIGVIGQHDRPTADCMLKTVMADPIELTEGDVNDENIDRSYHIERQLATLLSDADRLILTKIGHDLFNTKPDPYKSTILDRQYVYSLACLEMARKGNPVVLNTFKEKIKNAFVRRHEDYHDDSYKIFYSDGGSLSHDIFFTDAPDARIAELSIDQCEDLLDKLPTVQMNDDKKLDLFGKLVRQFKKKTAEISDDTKSSDIYKKYKGRLPYAGFIRKLNYLTHSLKDEGKRRELTDQMFGEVEALVMKISQIRSYDTIVI